MAILHRPYRMDDNHIMHCVYVTKHCYRVCARSHTVQSILSLLYTRPAINWMQQSVTIIRRVYVCVLCVCEKQVKTTSFYLSFDYVHGPNALDYMTESWQRQYFLFSLFIIIIIILAVTCVSTSHRHHHAHKRNWKLHQHTIIFFIAPSNYGNHIFTCYTRWYYHNLLNLWLECPHWRQICLVDCVYWITIYNIYDLLDRRRSRKKIIFLHQFSQ